MYFDCSDEGERVSERATERPVISAMSPVVGAVSALSMALTDLLVQMGPTEMLKGQ